MKKVIRLVREVLKWIRKGCIVSPRAIYRLSICFACKYYLVDKKKCIKCGCYMPLKTKLDTAKCPINKW